MDIELGKHQGLKLWLQTLTTTVRSNSPDLTSRQMSILLQVYLMPPSHTVRGLATTLNISKPVITRAIDALIRLGFVKRVRDENDKRSVLIQRTVKGAVFLTDFAEIMEKSHNKVN